MVMSQDQHAGQNHNVKMHTKSFERVESCKYFGTRVTHQNSSHYKFKSRLKSGNACYHSVQDLLSFILLSKNIQIQTNRTVILPVVLYKGEAWLLTLREKHGLKVFENRMLRRNSGLRGTR